MQPNKRKLFRQVLDLYPLTRPSLQKWNRRVTPFVSNDLNPRIQYSKRSFIRRGCTIVTALEALEASALIIASRVATTAKSSATSGLVLDQVRSTHSSQTTCCPSRYFKEDLFLNLSLLKPRQNTEAILKTYELFVFGDTENFIHSLCKTVLKVATPYPRL